MNAHVIPASEPVKFAYWVPNVSSGLVISRIEQRSGWDVKYNQELARIAERAGFDYATSRCRRSPRSSSPSER